MIASPDDASKDRRRGFHHSGLPQIGALPFGTHFCAFYETDEDLLDIVIPFMEAGITNNEYCLWVCSDEAEKKRSRAAFIERVGNGARLIELNKIDFPVIGEWYLRDGKFTPAPVLEGWENALKSALDRGFTGVRAHGNEAWITRETWDPFFEYEHRLDELIHDKPLIILCSFPLDDLLAREFLDIGHNHEFVLVRRFGKWEVLETAESISAKSDLKRLNEHLEELVAERTEQLNRTTRELARKEALYRFLTENINEAIALYDTDLRRVYLSPSVSRLLGDLPEDRFSGIHPADLSRAEEAWRSMVEGKPRTMEFRHRRSTDGSWRWLEVSGSKVNFDGEALILFVARDVTERVSLEQQLRQAQKMEALGRLAGGVAHDFNNLMTAVYGYAELADQDLPPGSPVRDSIEEIKRATDRAQRVTRQLLTFSRHDILQPERTKLRSLLRGMEPMLRLLVREDVSFDIVHCPDSVSVVIDPTHFEQMIVNLIANARGATRPGGSITITCDVVDAQGSDPALPEFVRHGRFARLRISDTGTGMSPDIRDRAFDPFFTTKPPGKGTGLGLSTVFGIAKQSGGYVWIDSEPDRGTTVSVLLPLAPPRVKREMPAKRKTAAPDLGGLTFLVVEDEDVVRHFVASVLRRSGAEVIETGSPSEALPFLGDSTVPLDVLISDVVMPGMNGPALVALAKRARPKLRTLLMSGYTADQKASDDAAMLTDVLEKPFRSDDLLRKVQSVLSDGSRRRSSRAKA